MEGTVYAFFFHFFHDIKAQSHWGRRLRRRGQNRRGWFCIHRTAGGPFRNIVTAPARRRCGLYAVGIVDRHNTAGVYDGNARLGRIFNGRGNVHHVFGGNGVRFQTVRLPAFDQHIDTAAGGRCGSSKKTCSRMPRGSKLLLQLCLLLRLVTVCATFAMAAVSFCCAADAPLLKIYRSF